VGGGRGVGSMESLVKTGKWSDGEKWLEKRDGAREVSEEVITLGSVYSNMAAVTSRSRH